MTIPPGSESDTLAAERIAVHHWRRAARQRAVALETLRRRPLVRVALALDRRIAPAMAVGRAGRRRLVAATSRAALAGFASPRRSAATAELAALTAALRALPLPPPLSRTVTVVAHQNPSAQRGFAPGAVDLVEAPVGSEVEAAAVARAAARATGELLCLLAPTSEPLEPEWLARLAEGLVDRSGAFSEEVVAATPSFVHPVRPRRAATPHDGLVRQDGLALRATADDVPVVRALRAGSRADLRGHMTEVAAGSAGCFLVDRRAYEAVGGLAPLPDLDAAVIDLAHRLRRAGGRVVHVPAAVLLDHRPVPNRRALSEPIAEEGPGWRAVVERQGPSLLRAARPGLDHLRFALSVAAPSAKVADRWGDWHLARGLSSELERLGHSVRLQTADLADSLAGRSCDVHVVLRGLFPVRRTPGQRHVLWVISHPEDVDDTDCDEADLVLVASSRFAAMLRERTSTPVEVLLQATDHRRFRPRPPDPAHVHPVTVVAKTRDQLRPMVADAIAVGLRPAIYGGGWRQLVDPSLIAADHVANEDLPAVYASAGVVLNDHWETMRVAGFVSNRVFDVLACGTPIISDHLPDLKDLFGDCVPTAADAAELSRLVAADLDDPRGARDRAARGRTIVLEAHTFAHRASELIALLAKHGLENPPG